MLPAGFEPTISAGKRPQTYASDRAATGTGFDHYYGDQIREDKMEGTYTHSMNEA